MKNNSIIVEKLCSDAMEALADNFVGFYIHGSLAMTGYNPEKSDIDYLIVCRREPDTETKRRLLDSAERLWSMAPAKGLEMHVMCLKECLHPADEPEFVLHYSQMHRQHYKDDPLGYIGIMHGGDNDLNAHITVLRERGVCVCGKPVKEVFGEISRKNYLASIADDAKWDSGEVLYHVLNSARTLAYLQEGCILSKREGGIWAIENGIHVSLMEEAVSCCGGVSVMEASEEAEGFCNEVYEKLIKGEIK